MRHRNRFPLQDRFNGVAQKRTFDSIRSAGIIYRAEIADIPLLIQENNGWRDRSFEQVCHLRSLVPVKLRGKARLGGMVTHLRVGLVVIRIDEEEAHTLTRVFLVN